MTLLDLYALTSLGREDYPQPLDAALGAADQQTRTACCRASVGNLVWAWKAGPNDA